MYTFYKLSNNTNIKNCIYCKYFLCQKKSTFWALKTQLPLLNTKEQCNYNGKQS